ncbi:MAG: exodeoxyribonuclease VII large subunit [Thermomicrobiales bacterium]
MSAYVVPVGAFVCLLRESLEADPFYSDLWLEGEISDLSQSGKGHIYFSLRDADGVLRCVMFRGSAMRAPRKPRLGDKVAVHGGLSIYPASGSLQLIADLVTTAGLGAAALELEYLRQRLEQEGLFDISRKRPLPPAPRTIGVVTSRHGAAWQDIQSVVARRYPLTELLLAHAQVQGEGSAESIVTAIEMLQFVETIDVIIVARGGGSSDDLAAFNDEMVVRAVFGSRVPVVTGVGHASDRTLVEGAADVCAPTPSAAAELCMPSQAELALHIGQLHARLTESLALTNGAAALRHERLNDRLTAAGPLPRVAAGRAAVSISATAMQTALHAQLTAAQTHVKSKAALLEALSPVAVLERGYAALSLPQERVALHSIEQVRPGVTARARVTDGVIDLTLVAARPATPMRTIS